MTKQEMIEEYAERIETTDVKAKTMLAYLQNLLDDFMKEEKRFGMEDCIVCKKFDAMIACKEMVECLICMPVNLQLDGKVTVGCI